MPTSNGGDVANFVIPTSTTAADTGRPRSVLADDNAGILKAISRMLASDFDDVAKVTDGHQALHTR